MYRESTGSSGGGAASSELTALDNSIVLLTASSDLSARDANTAALRAALESESQTDINLLTTGTGTVYINSNQTLFSNSTTLIKGLSSKVKIRANTQVTTGNVTISNSGGNLLVTFASAHGLSVNDIIFMNAASGANIYGGTMPGNVAVNELLYVKSVPSSTTITISKTAGGATVAYSSAGSGDITVFEPPVTTLHLDRGYVTGSGTAPAITSTTADRWSYIYDVASQSNITETIDGTPAYFKQLTIAGTDAANFIKYGDITKITANNPQRTGVVQSTGQVTVSSIDTGTDIVTTAAAHGASTGDIVWFEIASSDANYPVCTPTIKTFNVAHIRSLSATTLTLHPTEADALAGTNAYNFTAGITGGDTMYLNRAAYWNGVITTVHEVTTSGGNTLVKVNQFSESLNKDVRIAGFDMTFNPRLEMFDIEYEHHQMFAAARNNWPNAAYNLKPDVIWVVGACKPKDIDVGCRYGIGSGIRYLGCAHPFSFIPSSELGVNQEGTTYPQGDYNGGVFPSHAATAYSRAYTACGVGMLIGSFGNLNRHSPLSTEPMFLYPDVDPCVAGRDYPVVSGGNVVMGQAKDSGDDDHTNAMPNFRQVTAVHNAGNAVNRRASGEIWLTSIDNVRDGQFSGTRENPIEVFLHVQSINSGHIEVKEYATVHLYGFKSGTRAGATSNKMFDVTSSSGELVFHDVDVECDDINNDGVLMLTAGKMRGSVNLKPMPKLTLAREAAGQGGVALGDHFANACALQMVLGSGGSCSLTINLEGKGWTTGRTSGSGGVPANTGTFFVESGEGGGVFQSMNVIERNTTNLPYQPLPDAPALFKTETANDTTPEYQAGISELQASFTGVAGSRLITSFQNCIVGRPFLYRITSGASSAVMDFSNSGGSSTVKGNAGVNYTFVGATAAVWVVPGLDGNQYCTIIED